MVTAGKVAWSRARASLPARVAALTAVAVGMAVAVMAVAAYLTVRSQLMHSLDASLLHRAKVAAERHSPSAMVDAPMPAWVLHVANMRIFVLMSGQPISAPAAERFRG